MDMLKKELAPISTHVWEEIESRAAEVLRSRLSARKVVRVVGPLGWKHTAVTEGRLDLADENSDVKVGVFRVTPLSEARVRFSLNRWEMDNLNRGAKDIDLDALDAAAEKIADFEEQAIYNGYKAGGIVGLTEVASHKPIKFGTDGPSIMESISLALITLRTSYAVGPCSLIVGTKAYLELNKVVQGTPILERIERLLGSKVIHSFAIDGALLLPFDDENLELTVGQDFAIGYEAHDTKEVTLFITESFTFRVLDPALIIPFTV